MEFTEEGHPVANNEAEFSEYLNRASEKIGYSKPYSEIAAMSESDLGDYCKAQLHTLQQLCVGRKQTDRIALHLPSASNGKYEERFLTLLSNDKWIQLMPVEAYISDQIPEILPKSYTLGRIPVHSFRYVAGLTHHSFEERGIFTFVWERLGSLWHAADFEYVQKGKEVLDDSDVAELLNPRSRNILRKMLDSHFETIQSGGAYVVDAYRLKDFPPSTLDVMQRLLGNSGETVGQMLVAWGYSLELLPVDAEEDTPRFAVIRRRDQGNL